MIFKNSNFSEQSAWISVIFAIFIAAFYGYGMMQLEGSFSTHAEQIVWLWIETIVVSIVFVIIAFSILSVIKSKNGDDDELGLIDERDEAIEVKATLWAYFNLHFCLTILLVHVFCQSVIVDYPFFSNVPPVDFLIHGLMFAGLLVELVLRATQIYRYRKAA
ncbi:MAG: hypothetical protein HRT51_19715 [Colwellia sp.]|nr:hypothetical protein [Colwellia sp.]